MKRKWASQWTIWKWSVWLSNDLKDRINPTHIKQRQAQIVNLDFYLVISINFHKVDNINLYTT